MEALMITAIIDNLNTAKVLVDKMTSQQFTDTTIGPYNSSIGGHLRHILDIFGCAFEGVPKGHVSLIARERNELIETIPAKASEYIDTIIASVESAKDLDGSMILKVTDDLGAGPVTVDYTLAGLFAQAHSHAIHHYASMGYMLDQLGIEIPNPRFGYNPTTPERV